MTRILLSVHESVSSTRQLGRFAILLAFFLHGCGKSWHAETFPSHGQVFVNGNPAEGAIVMFHHKTSDVDSRGTIPWGLVDSNGSYDVGTYDKHDGIPAGEYAVCLVWAYDNNSAGSPDRLGGKYFTPTTPAANVVINETSNEIPAIRLEGVRIVPPSGQPTEEVKEGHSFDTPPKNSRAR